MVEKKGEELSEGRKYNPETFKEIYELTRGSLDRQVDQGQMLDAKMVQIFSAASIIIGLAGFSVSGGAVRDVAVGVLLALALALASYGAVAYVAFRNLAPSTYQLLYYPDVWRRSWDEEPDELHHSVITKIAGNYERNALVLVGKAKALRIAIGAAGIEVALVGIALISVLFG